MITQSTADKLIEMRLTAMADLYRTQQNDPKLNSLSFDDRFGMLVDVEYDSRKSNRRKRLIKGAGFDQPEASIMDIDYISGRKLNKQLIRKLASCDYVSEISEYFHHWCHRERKDLYGMCSRYGGMQALYQNTICTSSGSSH